MGLKRSVLVIMVFLFIGSCSIMKDDMLNLIRLDYFGTDLRLDGYWWNDLESNLPSINTYFFYKNGVTLYGRVLDKNNLEKEEENFETESFRKLIHNSKSGWGVFQINSGKLKFETWEPSNGGPLKTVVRSGEIIDEETFVITSFQNNYSGKTSVRNDTFHFKKFSPKPDSTNVFIK